tara:strand:- start:3711 stop:4160 length:450 start_codon:yes stop_codon:yes gene_type:complete
MIYVLIFAVSVAASIGIFYLRKTYQEKFHRPFLIDDPFYLSGFFLISVSFIFIVISIFFLNSLCQESSYSYLDVLTYTHPGCTDVSEEAFDFIFGFFYIGVLIYLSGFVLNVTRSDFLWGSIQSLIHTLLGLLVAAFLIFIFLRNNNKK